MRVLFAFAVAVVIVVVVIECVTVEVVLYVLHSRQYYGVQYYGVYNNIQMLLFRPTVLHAAVSYASLFFRVGGRNK